MNLLHKIGKIMSIVYLFTPFYFFSKENVDIVYFIIFGICGLCYLIWRYDIYDKYHE